MPKNAPGVITELAKRSLISIRQAVDSKSGLSVGSIATQSPYGVDWIREGAYVNEALHRAGHPEMVKKHDVRYGQLQASASSKPPGGTTTPSGNWSQNYYADGVVGGNLPYEIDETGLGIWTLWDHYTETSDRDYLISSDIYESIQRAAHYLTDDTPLGCRDPATGLQCNANEEDDPNLRRTLIGAQAAWLGVSSAAKAARIKGGVGAEANAIRWQTRADELRDAIRQNFFDGSCDCYTRDYQTGGTLLWPVRYVPPELQDRRRTGGGELETHIARAPRQGGPWRARDPRAARQLVRVGRGPGSQASEEGPAVGRHEADHERDRPARRSVDGLPAEQEGHANDDGLAAPRMEPRDVLPRGPERLRHRSLER